MNVHLAVWYQSVKPGYEGVLYLFSNLISALYQTICVCLCLDVPQLNIVRQRAKQGDTVANQDRYPGNNQLLNQAFGQKALNSLAAINVEMFGPTF